MPDDEKILQVIQRRNLLSSEQIEAVNQEIRHAAEHGEELTFLQAALRKALLYDSQAQEVQQEAEREVSTSETEEIQPAAQGDTAQAACEAAGSGGAVEADVPMAEPAPESEAAADKPAGEAQTADTTDTQEAAPLQKVAALPIVLGALLLAGITVLVALLNR